LHAIGAAADYVIVPAMEPEGDTAITAWLKGQAYKGRASSACAAARVSWATLACSMGGASPATAPLAPR